MVVTHSIAVVCALVLVSRADVTPSFTTQDIAHGTAGTTNTLAHVSTQTTTTATVGTTPTVSHTDTQTTTKATVGTTHTVPHTDTQTATKATVGTTHTVPHTDTQQTTKATVGTTHTVPHTDTSTTTKATVGTTHTLPHASTRANASAGTTHHAAPVQYTSNTQAHATSQPHTTAHAASTTANSLQQIESLLHSLQNEMQNFKASMNQRVGGLARQMMLQQLFVEERIRSEGGSGIKQIRSWGSGTKPYHFNTHASSATAAMHEHSNYDRTVGLGEINAVLNGVDFRTRHNDYKLRMPHQSRKDYDLTEDIPFPDVPPSVRNKHTVTEQIDEMRAYFKAFHFQDTHIRDYTPYFKPVMCYLEGAWTTDTKTLTEPFQSDRHFIDASSWFDLQEKIRYMSASGDHNQQENYSYLPTTIVNVTDDGEPVYAQWNYRIVCHPISTALKLADFEPIDDLAVRMLNNINMSVYSNHKSTRFSIAPYGGNHYQKELQSGQYGAVRYNHGKLDNIMYEIPGKDNYMAHIEDRSFDTLKMRIDVKNETLNVGKYNRHYQTTRVGAMGLALSNRGFSDPNMFVAETTNPRVAKMRVTDCHKDHGKDICSTYEARFTYAVPLEVIWLTPLSKWNPYNLSFYNYDVPGLHGRNGGFTTETAYNGTSLNFYYLTPVDFFYGGDAARDPADTAKDAVGVLDAHGNVCNVTASGVRIFTPEISGVGKVRIRYPVFPLHQDGNAVNKNLLALQDITMNMKKWSTMFEQKPEVTNLNAHAPDTHYATGDTHMNPPGTHHHDFYLTAEEMQALTHNNTVVSVYTTKDNGHQHQLEIIKDPAHPDFTRVIIKTCDGQATCWDEHPSVALKQN